MRYAIKICYDGRGFSGSQRQLNERTVEGEFLRALKKLRISYSSFKAAGRTDKGVSAIGNVFALNTAYELMEARILNTVLPRNIKIRDVKKVDSNFNPRHAGERVYKYFLVDKGYEIGEMKKAASVFIGEKSFHNFSSTDYRNSIRTVRRIDVRKHRGVITISVSGQSFLWQMVRRIVTALKMAGMGELDPGELKGYFDPVFKRKIPPSPAENLVLWDVKYDFEFKDEEYSKKRLVKMLKKQWMQAKTEACVLGEVLGEIK